jgi:hypothetical protein
MCRSAQRRTASSGSVNVRPAAVSEYSTVTGTVALTRRSTSPSSSVTDRCPIADGELLSYRKSARTSAAGAGLQGHREAA